MRILHAIHDFLPIHAAGSEIYADHLCRELGRRHQVHVLAATYDPTRGHGELVWRDHDRLPVTEVVNNWRFDSFAASYRDPALTAVLDHVLAALAPDVLHLHSLFNLSFALPALARARGIPSVATLHDYTLVCPSGGQRLHRAEDHVCHTIDPERCRRCFAASPFHAQMVLARAGLAGSHPVLGRLGRLARRLFPVTVTAAARHLSAAPMLAPTAADIELRLAAARGLFHQIDRFVAPSRSLGEEFLRLGLPADRLRIADYGFPVAPPPPRRPRTGRLRIGFVGTLVWHKGAHVLLRALADLPRDQFEVILSGNPGTFPDYTAELRRLAAGLPVTFAGTFPPAEAAAAYSRLDVLVVPSLWLENSPLVIHEAFQAGVPVVGARIGGICDLIEDGVNGLLYEPRSPGDLARTLGQLIAHPARLAELSAALPAVRTIAEDARGWEEIYHGVLGRALEPA